MIDHLDVLGVSHVSTVPPPWTPSLSAFRIKANENTTSNGGAIMTIYDAGNFPYFTGTGGECKADPGDWNCTSAIAHFGGLPQATDLTAHLAQLRPPRAPALVQWGSVQRDKGSWYIEWRSNT